MVVDDSAVIRGLLTRSLESDPELAVVASASNGQMALGSLKRHDIEVVVLDIEMPVMDGLTALPQLLAANPTLKIIIASTLTRRGADISMKALASGASDYVTKPGASALTSAADFKRELVAKVKALGHARRSRLNQGAPARPAPNAARTAAASAVPTAVPTPAAGRAIAVRPMTGDRPQALAIGSSTGGPQALLRLFETVRGDVKQPIFITQHMPATFTAILAEHLARASGLPAAEGVDGEPVQGGRIYVAPGDFHMTVEAGDGGKVIRLTKAPPENFCRPSVDPMLRSLAQLYGRHLLCTILTGMGHDGLGGGQAVVAAGGTVIAQDEATSVVWGMPGAVATAGLCSAVLPLPEIGPLVRRLAGIAGGQ
jgi:two-component system chemotaxis response regulator CheB